MWGALGYAAWLALWAPAGSVATDPDAPWIRYRLGQGETLESVATRYDVGIEEIVAANERRSDFRKGDIIRLQPRKFVPPRASKTIKSSERRTWEQVAQRHGVEGEALRRWNPRLAKRARVPSGATLTVWFDSGVTRFPYATDPEPLPDFETRGAGYSIGKPHRGRIENAVQLPASDHYTIRFDRVAWGSSLAVRNIQRALAGFRRDSGYAGPLLIGGMSRKTGRRLRPHRSHQSGRDIDVRLPAMSFATGYRLQANEIDWHATWMLVEAFVRTDAVQVIFLERKLFARLRSAAMRMGADDARIQQVMKRVRHSKGHTGHIHVRFVCAPEAAQCVQARDRDATQPQQADSEQTANPLEP